MGRNRVVFGELQADGIEPRLRWIALEHGDLGSLREQRRRGAPFRVPEVLTGMWMVSAHGGAGSGQEQAGDDNHRSKGLQRVLPSERRRSALTSFTARNEARPTMGRPASTWLALCAASGAIGTTLGRSRGSRRGSRRGIARGI